MRPPRKAHGCCSGTEVTPGRGLLRDRCPAGRRDRPCVLLPVLPNATLAHVLLCPHVIRKPDPRGVITEVVTAAHERSETGLASSLSPSALLSRTHVTRRLPRFQGALVPASQTCVGPRMGNVCGIPGSQ